MYCHFKQRESSDGRAGSGQFASAAGHRGDNEGQLGEGSQQVGGNQSGQEEMNH